MTDKELNAEAFDTMVRLRMDVCVHEGVTDALALNAAGRLIEIHEGHTGDAAEATRRAITRVAAQLKEQA